MPQHPERSHHRTKKRWRVRVVGTRFGSQWTGCATASSGGFSGAHVFCSSRRSIVSLTTTTGPIVSMSSLTTGETPLDLSRGPVTSSRIQMGTGRFCARIDSMRAQADQENADLSENELRSVRPRKSWSALNDRSYLWQTGRVFPGRVFRRLNIKPEPNQIAAGNCRCACRIRRCRRFAAPWLGRGAVSSGCA